MVHQRTAATSTWCAAGSGASAARVQANSTSTRRGRGSTTTPTAWEVNDTSRDEPELLVHLAPQALGRALPAAQQAAGQGPPPGVPLVHEQHRRGVALALQQHQRPDGERRRPGPYGEHAHPTRQPAEDGEAQPCAGGRG